MYSTAMGQTSGETCIQAPKEQNAFALISQAKGQGTGRSI